MSDKHFPRGKYESAFTTLTKQWVSQLETTSDDDLVSKINEIVDGEQSIEGVPLPHLSAEDIALLTAGLEARLKKIVSQKTPRGDLIELIAQKMGMIASRMKVLDDKKYKMLTAPRGPVKGPQVKIETKRSRAEQRALDNDLLAGKVLQELLATAPQPNKLQRRMLDDMLRIEMDELLPSTARALLEAAKSIDIAYVPTDEVQYFSDLRQQWDNEVALIDQLQAGEHTAVVPGRARVLADRAHAMGQATQEVPAVPKNMGILAKLLNLFKKRNT